MNLQLELARAQTRRQFLKQTGIGAIAFAAMLQRDGRAAAPTDNPLTPRSPSAA